MPEELLTDMASPGNELSSGSALSFWEWPGLPEPITYEPVESYQGQQHRPGRAFTFP